MSEMDEVSRSIGKLQGKVEGIEKSQTAIFTKLEVMHKDQIKQKIYSTTEITRLSGKIGFVTAIITFGVFEGVRLWIRTHNGQ
jgi:uncharacterized protein YoxC